MESKVDGTESSSDQLKEIGNIENAMNFIDEHLKSGDDITEHFVRELHAIAVVGLEREGIELRSLSAAWCEHCAIRASAPRLHPCCWLHARADGIHQSPRQTKV